MPTEENEGIPLHAVVKAWQGSSFQMEQAKAQILVTTQKSSITWRIFISAASNVHIL